LHGLWLALFLQQAGFGAIEGDPFFWAFPRNCS
jgi:hypothetical protein